MTRQQLDALGAVRAVSAAGAARLLIATPLTRCGESNDGATARAVLSRAVGLACAGRRVSALVAGPLDCATTLSSAVGRRLPLVLHLQARTLPRQGLGEGAGHDDLASLSRSGAPVFVARDAQHAADLTLMARRLAESALTPVVILHDAQPPGAGVRDVEWPGPRALAALLGTPSDRVAAATPGQLALYGAERPRLPRLVDPDRPTTSGGVTDPAADARGQVAAALWHGEPLAALVDRACADVARVTERPLARLSIHGMERSRLVLVACGSLLPLAEAVADTLRATRRLRVGVVGLDAPLPLADGQLVAQLRGRSAVAVLERTALPSDDDPPLTTMVRAAFARAVENGRARGALPHPSLAPLAAKDLPALFCASCGVAGHEPSPGDLAALIEHMRHPDENRRRVILGLDCVRSDVSVPKLQLWQQQLLDSVPDLAELTLAPLESIDLLPDDALSLCVHDTLREGEPVVGHGAAARLVAELARTLGRSSSCWPSPGPERLGQPTTFRALLADASSPLLAPPSHSQLTIVGAPRALPVEQLLAELAPGATLLIEHNGPSDALWPGLPRRLQRALIAGEMTLASVSCAKAGTGTSDGDDGRPRDEQRDTPADASATRSAGDTPRARQARREATLFGAALLLASRTLGRADDTTQLLARWSRATDDRGDKAGVGDSAGVDSKANVGSKANIDDRASVRSAVQRGLESVVIHALGTECGPSVEAALRLPAALDHEDAPGPGHAGHFWERVGHGLLSGTTPLADPEAASAVLPACSAGLSDQSACANSLPSLDTQRCTACGECWMQCPDGALDPRAVAPEVLLRTVYEKTGAQPQQPLAPLLASVARQYGKVLRKTPGAGLSDGLQLAWEQLRDKLPGGATSIEVLDGELAALCAGLDTLPLARTDTLFDEPEAESKGSGRLLALAVDPGSCKACGVCVDVCPEQAFAAVETEPAVLLAAREARALVAALPPNDPSLRTLGEVGARLTTPVATSLCGGDGACAGCGEKTALRQTLAALQLHRAPLVDAHLAQLEQLIGGLNEQAAALVSGELDLLAVARGGGPADLSPAHDAQLRRLAAAAFALTEQAARYGARGAASLVGGGGCSTRWSSAWPLTPHTLPFSAQSAEDSPDVALGLFEGQLEDLVGEVTTLRRAQALLAGREPAAAPHDWRELKDEELALCPPVLLVGGDGSLGDAALGRLSALLDSGRPLRIVVLDNQLAADCGGRETRAGLLTGGTTGGTTGNALGSARHDLAWMAIAQRHTFVLQSSPAYPEHLAAGLRRGFVGPHPALFVLYATCPLHHRLAPSRAASAARLATLCRAHPLLLHDPQGGAELAARLELDGNPAPDDDWVTRDGVPITPAHWAATEGRFADWLRPLADDEAGALPLHEHLATAPAERPGQLPWVTGPAGTQLVVAPQLVELVAERRDFWRLLREVSGASTPTAERAAIEDALAARLRSDFDEQLEQERARHAAELAETRQRLPLAIARRLATGLLRSGDGQQTVAELLAEATGAAPLDDIDISTLLPTVDAPDAAPPGTGDTAQTGEGATPGPADSTAQASNNGAGVLTAGDQPTTIDAPTSDSAAVDTSDKIEEEDDEDFAIDPSIQSIRCTTCNECTNLNGRMFAYNDKRQAYVKDPDAGSFAELVKAAEICPVAIIHPGTPRDPDEAGLGALLQRAARFG